jgi:hypothetical protein
MSRTGILFRGEALLEDGDRVALRFELPLEIYGQPAALVACHGAIVRSVQGEGKATTLYLAASITHFRIVRRRSAAEA